jgi:hypothetical protein
MTTYTPRYRFAVKYAIVDRFGDILFYGRAEINSPTPIPADEKQRAVYLVDTAVVIRDTVPPEAPVGRVVILATIPDKG